MRWSAAAEEVLEALKRSREPDSNYFRVGPALLRILDLAPRSLIGKALYEDEVWRRDRRGDHRRAMAQSPEIFDLPIGAGLEIGHFVQEVEAHAAAAHSDIVSEGHIVWRLAWQETLLQPYGIDRSRLVARVTALEREQAKTAVPASDLCFILMSFATEYDAVYTSAIQRAAAAVGLRCKRADDIASPGVVMEQIDAAIDEARVIVADLTGKNPNVMLETGHARALKKPIVFITQDPYPELPFDTKHYRTKRYELSDLDALRDWLVESLEAVLREPYSVQAHLPPIKLGMDYVTEEIEPPLVKAGWELAYPLIGREEEMRLKGWEDVRVRDSMGMLRPVRTEDHAVFMRPMVQ